METIINNTQQTQEHFSKLLLHLNIPLSSPHDFSGHLTHALQTLGEYSHHDRIHIIEIHRNMTFTVRHEWYAQQLEPIPEKWKHAHLIYRSLWEKQLNTQNYIIIRDEQDEDPEIHSLLQEQNCHQMLLLPLFESGSQLAFIVFMQCKQEHEWQPDEIHTLADLSSVIATQLNNYQLMKCLLQHLKKHQEEKVPIEILHNRLKRLQAEILPTWDRIRKTVPKNSEIDQLDQHLTTFDKLCRILSEK